MGNSNTNGRVDSSQQAHRSGSSKIGLGSNNLNLTNMQTVAMNMMAFKNSKSGIS